MKLRYIFTALAAAALAFVGCQEEEHFLDEFQLSETVIALPVEGGQFEVTVKATADWTVAENDEWPNVIERYTKDEVDKNGVEHKKGAVKKSTPSWLSIDVVSGSAGEYKVTFSAEATTETRECNVPFICGGYHHTVKVFQMAEKVEVPFTTCADVNNNGVDGKVYRVKGTVTSIANTTYGNWYLTDETGTVYIYGTLYNGATKQFLNHGIEVGDIVTVEGPRKDYNGTIELVDVTVVKIEKSLLKVEKVSPEGPLCAEGDVFTVTLTNKGGDLVISIPEADQAWLSYSEPFVSGSTAVVEFTAAANEGDARTTTITFTTESNDVVYTSTVEMKQKGGAVQEPVAPSTIASVLALGKDATIPDNTFVEGVVVSNAALNNLTSKKGMYIQDETGALQLRFSADHTFAFGEKLRLDLSGLKVGAYNGAVQISIDNDKATSISTGNVVTPKTVAIADFLANKYEGQYVAVEGVQVVEADLAKTWGDASGSSHVSINMEDAKGNTFVVFSSKYSTFGATAVGQGSGTIKGIAAVNNGKVQIIFAQESDFAGLTGARLSQSGGDTPAEPETPASGKFVKVSAEQTDWSGKYLIVFGTNAHATLAASGKDLNSTAAVTIVNNEIAASDDLAAAVMTVVKNGNDYNMTFADGKYFGMQHNGCKLMDSAFPLGFAYTADGVKISGVPADKTATYFLYANTSNGAYYRCYVEKNGQAGYTLPTLYKLAE